jgi:hypothetical protein
MDQKSTPMPYDENNKSNFNKEEYNQNRDRYINQICNVKETYLAGMRKIEDDFAKVYDEYTQSLLKQICEFNKLIEANIISSNKKKECYLEINSFLKQILEDKCISYQNYINEVANLTQQLIDKYYQDNAQKVVDFIGQIIQLQNEEENKRKNELLKQEENKRKLEINGEDNSDEKLQQYVMSTVQVNFNKLIIKKMTKERLEVLFSHTYPFYKKLYNYANEPNNKHEGETTNPGDKSRNKKNTKIASVVIKDSTLKEMNLVDFFPYIDNLKIINSKMAYNISETIKYEKLISLKLENVGLINENFNNLFEQLRKNDAMRKNLKIFSVKRNYITFLDYKKSYADNILKLMRFNCLEVLDMSYNKLYLFQNQIFNCLDSIKIIDLSNNNIAFPTSLTDLLNSAKYKKCLVLMINNLAILKEKSSVEYTQYLIDILPEIDYPIKGISLDNLFFNNNFKNISRLGIGKFRDSLTYLNLSNSQFNDDTLISLLKEQWIFPNLTSLILEKNFLTQEFLYSLINKKYNFDKIFLKLKVINLSENQIKCSDVSKFKQFLEFFKTLKVLELKNTPIEYTINQYLRKRVIKHYDQKNIKIREHSYNEDEKKIEEILENNYLQTNTNVTIYILDLINTKYTNAICSLFKHVLNGLNMENKFPLKT